MADSYIDYQETQTYGKHLVLAANRLAKRYPVFSYIGKEVHTATLAVGAELIKVRGTQVTRSKEIEGKQDVLPKARKALTATSLWVRFHSDEVREEEFFPKGRSHLGRPELVLEALGTCMRALDAHKSVLGAKEQRAVLDKIAKRLEAAIEASKEAKHRVTNASPALEAARERWLLVYSGVKHLARGTFILAGLDTDAFMKDTFADLAVVEPARRKKRQSTTAAPQASEVVNG